MTDEDDKPAGNGPQEQDAADNGAAEESQEKTAETLSAELEAAEARAQENWSEFLRARAEMENLRRRAEKDVAAARQQSLEKLAGELLAVKDSLEMGLQAARDENADAARLAEGSELTLRMFDQALEKFNIEAINPQGERFDPERHEAMTAQETDEQAPNTVVSVIQKGYRLGDRLLRPARVIVAKAPADSGDEA
ncbi:MULTISPECIES: nucleotide exchange factor GrpE [Spiribacter]|jgi:molecular chaperone GrpE|uniref:Protein GrpE n=1 Tax=Spiribacter aquaticus TaxID=1935996 RepID=A0A557RF69_9GAMM|nr:MULTISPECIES: nucleotide exchange factor GrpE [Spiribacter]PZA00550.1 nucleotide exchange factor GrpE [Gammaproteobacteria bacterium 2W06]AUB78409.1 nucleotide exchange factor GrpE [Spiribacter roseus]KAF0280376.1 nucleotide exchange factor GrpE [Spiribacter roseus]KAF0282803.1 nucleotide exchange factor GrpE [Spiribacter roseus]KAF0283355.1 nucleotide exchange factor GrpE [Spiribacter roseus]